MHACLILQVDFRIEVNITGVATRGYKQYWVKNYYMEFSNDGWYWLKYKEPGETFGVCNDNNLMLM